jgi:hypothetical protein
MPDGEYYLNFKSRQTDGGSSASGAVIGISFLMAIAVMVYGGYKLKAWQQSQKAYYSEKGRLKAQSEK